MLSVEGLLELFVMRIRLHKPSWAVKNYLRHEKPLINQALFVVHRTAEVTMLQTNFQQVTNGDFQRMTKLLLRETRCAEQTAKMNYR
ncbi:hypothetical protein [Vibrio sp. NH-UV-68]|uniref:hypothetical protein n=1 Tax=unclassified Vibrio TaxID=2614977 RepID=UPI0036F363D8